MRHAKPLSPLNTGDDVKFKHGTSWKPAVVTKVTQYPRSYIIRTPDGQTYRRNRRHIRPSPKTKEIDEDEDVPSDNRADGGGQSDDSAPTSHHSIPLTSTAADVSDPVTSLPSHCDDQLDPTLTLTAMPTCTLCNSKHLKLHGKAIIILPSYMHYYITPSLHHHHMTCSYDIIDSCCLTAL